jgi:dihydroorotase
MLRTTSLPTPRPQRHGKNELDQSNLKALLPHGSSSSVATVARSCVMVSPELSTQITIRAPDDFHVHLRDGDMLDTVAPLTAAQFARALVMPNLQPPVRTTADAAAYRARIMATLPADSQFQALMTLYLTDQTSAEDIVEAKTSGFVVACKLYPAGATTNSFLGVTSLESIAPALSAMQDCGMILCVHGEVTGADVDVFDREPEFVSNVLPSLLATYPTLKIVLEHVTTRQAAEMVMSTLGNRLAATITAHHLLYSRSALFAGAKIHPDMYCLPILKREGHRQALLAAVANDDRGLFFAGTDSAPHARGAKLCASGCAGIFSATSAVELYAEALQEANALCRLEAFLSTNGADFYGLPRNSSTITLVQANPGEERNIVPLAIVGKNCTLTPLRAGESLSWSVEK